MFGTRLSRMKLFLLALTVGLVSCQVIPGGVLEQDPKDPMFKKPARVAATYTDNQNPVSLSAQYGPRYEVIAASTQTLCDVKVLKQAWLHFIGLNGTPDCRVIKRHLGGYNKVESTSPAVKAAAAFAVDAMNKQSNSINRIMLIKVVRAQQQVVAGTNYKLVLKVGVSSSCRNDGTIGMTVLNCPVDQRKQKCDVIVWDQPWRTPRYKLTSFKCQ